MIYTGLDTLRRYSALGSRFEKAFQFVATHAGTPLPEGRHEIDGDTVFANVAQAQSRAADALLLENHHRYIDLQLLLEGEEHIWVDSTAALPLATPYDSGKDIEFYHANPSTTRPLLLRPGRLLLLWPGEAHAPCIAVDKPQPVRRLVVKIKTDR